MVLIVGADQLGNIQEELSRDGAREIIHWTGRCKTCVTKCIPKRVDKVVVFCDFINHGLMGSIKKQAKRSGIPVVYCRRSLSQLRDPRSCRNGAAEISA